MNARIPKKTKPSTSLMVRLDAKSKAQLHKAAKLRDMSLSDYVRLVTVSQARREIEGKKNDDVIHLSPKAQLAFWKALHAPVKLTPRLRKLGAMIRGEE